jgi:hypothetical protein
MFDATYIQDKRKPYLPIYNFREDKVHGFFEKFKYLLSKR